ncbi:branched-chain amino acid ABC transporter permease, partial [Rhodoblastus sp.]|uniref:branched-chain amino acid ABC transporter permease n=1 Tax=Rhodoblastus sp. TaxID=1962975 RepID=UPI003F982D67
MDSPPSLCLSPRGERERPKFPRPLDRRSFSPWGEGQDERVLFMTFFVETVMSGLLTGVMYSLVALGFVLIYKASGVFNFAQGVMALFAALTLTGLMNEYHLPVWAALPLTVAVMAGLAFAVEFAILRRLVNQEPIVLFMATLGLAYILEGLGDILWGPDVKVLDLGLPGGASGYLLDNFNIYIERIELVAAGTAAVLVAVLAVFFQHTRTGRALRAVADDHQA